MDFFKFNYDTDPTVLQHGEMIHNLDKTTWVERYRDPGEFSFEAKVSTGIKEFLPEDTLISHPNTLEVMIVENHEINETAGDDPTIVVTGRTFVSYLEQRIIGMEIAKTTPSIVTYDLVSDTIWNQVVKIIQDHLTNPADANDALTNVICTTDVTTGSGIVTPRTVQFGNVLERVLELLKAEDLGIKTIRRNPFGAAGSPTETVISIYRGADRTSDVIFSWRSGDLESAKYLFTNKDNKNSALIMGQYIYTIVEDPALTKYNRRSMIVDAKDIDGNLSSTPSGSVLTDVLNAMTARGQQALANQNKITIMESDLSNVTQYTYRKDFNVGDLVTVDGNYNQIAAFRVVEYAEIEDKDGFSGHPTLALPGA